MNIAFVTISKDIFVLAESQGNQNPIIFPWITRPGIQPCGLAEASGKFQHSPMVNVASPPQAAAVAIEPRKPARLLSLRL
jgi:hypothetical protein